MYYWCPPIQRNADIRSHFVGIFRDNDCFTIPMKKSLVDSIQVKTTATNIILVESEFCM